MKNFKTIKLYALAAFISFGLVSCSSDDETGTVQLDTIAGIASDNANLSILVQALVKADLEADTFFPKIDSKIWKKTDEICHEQDEKNQYDFCFQTYEKIKSE